MSRARCVGRRLLTGLGCDGRNRDREPKEAQGPEYWSEFDVRLAALERHQPLSRRADPRGHVGLRQAQRLPAFPDQRGELRNSVDEHGFGTGGDRHLMRAILGDKMAKAILIVNQPYAILVDSRVAPAPAIEAGGTAAPCALGR